MPVARRADAWFEIHDLKDASVCPPDYVAALARLDRPVWTIEPDPRIPKSVAYPRAEMVAKYGPYFFTSSLSWMFALALEQEGVEEIGLWGVDMAATEEYGLQRPGCHFFVMLALGRGIKVRVPPQSDLLAPTMQYGFHSTAPMYKKLVTRKAELEARVATAATAYENARNEFHFLKGALDDVQYQLNTWIGSLPL